MPVCSYCKSEGRLAAKGLCGTCYARYRRNGTAVPRQVVVVTQCEHCHTTNGPFIKSLCRPCYQRRYKYGDPELRRTRSLCEIDGCDEPVKSLGLCGKHYMRYRRHGDANVVNRPEHWGSHRSDPLYERWRSLMRSARLSGGVVPAWDTFEGFRASINDPPSPTARLYRIDRLKPYGPDNVQWRERVQEAHSGITREERNAYMREYSRKRPHVRKEHYLRKLYGVGLAEYERLLAAQDGVCAICKRPETAINPRTGEPFLLAVDHDHTTGKIRGLLCMKENRGLGLFDDSIDRLRAAIAYLEHHAEKGG